MGSGLSAFRIRSTGTRLTAVAALAPAATWILRNSEVECAVLASSGQAKPFRSKVCAPAVVEAQVVVPAVESERGELTIEVSRTCRPEPASVGVRVEGVLGACGKRQVRAQQEGDLEVREMLARVVLVSSSSNQPP